MNWLCCLGQCRHKPPPILEVQSSSPPGSPPFYRRAGVDFNIDSEHDIVSKPFTAFLKREDEVQPLAENDTRHTITVGDKVFSIIGTTILPWIEEGKSEIHSSTFLVAAGEEVYFDLLVGRDTIAKFKLPKYKQIKKQKAHIGKMKFWGKGRSEKSLQ